MLAMTAAIATAAPAWQATRVDPVEAFRSECTMMKRSLRSWLWRVPLDQEVDEELALHVELRTRELVERGLDPKTARDIVLSRIGDLGQLKRTCVDLGRKREREMRLTRFIEEFRDDVRLAIRQLVKAPGFTIVATITLALGIGVNSAIFALVDATLLRPLPFHEPDRLVAVWERTDRTAHGFASPLNMHGLEPADAIVRADLRICSRHGRHGDERQRRHRRDGVAPVGAGGIFDVLGVKPVVGRMFRPDDNDQRKNMVVLSEGFWRTRYGGDPSIVGREVRFDGEPYTVVGVAPKEFTLLGDTAMWGLRWIPPAAAVSRRVRLPGRRTTEARRHAGTGPGRHRDRRQRIGEGVSAVEHRANRVTGAAA